MQRIDTQSSAASGAVGKTGNWVLAEIAHSMTNAADGMLKTLTSFWMNIDNPNLNAAHLIQTSTSWITALVAIASILVAAARIAIR